MVPGKHYMRRLCFPFTGDSFGGSHISSLLLIRRLVDEGYQVTVAIHQPGRLTRECENKGIAYRLVDLPVAVGRDSTLCSPIRDFLSTFFKIWRFLGSARPEIVHTNDMRTHLFWTIPAWVRGIPTIWHQRTLFPDSRLARLTGWFVSRCIAISLVGQRSLPDRMKSRSTIIPNPVQPSQPDRADLAQAKRLVMETISESIDVDDLIIIGFFGALRSLKRPLVFVDVVGVLTQTWEKNVVGLMFGKDMEGISQNIRDHAKEQGLENRIHLMGFQDSIDRYISVCDVLVSTSVGDAFGRTLIEGMALGVPVVAVNAGGHPEVVRDGVDGILAQQDEPESVARAVQSVLDNYEFRESLIAAGRKAAQTKFSIESHTSRMAEIYQELISTPSI